MNASLVNRPAVVLAAAILFSTSATAERAARRSANRFSPHPADKWDVAVSKDPLNDKPVVVAALPAEAPIHGWVGSTTPTLIVSCHTPTDEASISSLSTALPVQPGLELYIVTDMAASVENTQGVHTIQVRFDERPADRWVTLESTDKTALFVAPIYATRLVVTDKLLLNSHRMFVRFTPFNAPPATITFDLRGFGFHAHELLSACPSVDQSHWRLPRGGPRYERRNASRRRSRLESLDTVRKRRHHGRVLDARHTIAQI